MIFPAMRGEIAMIIKIPAEWEERIILRPAQVWHAATMLEKIDPETAPNLQFCAEPITLERQQAYLKRMIESPTDHLFVIIRRQDKALLGTIGLHEHDKFNRTARLGRWIFSAIDRQQGYGSEAVFHLFRHYAFCLIQHLERQIAENDGLPLHKVYVNLFVTNTSAQEYFKALGFKKECVLKKEYLLRGKWHDMVRLALFREDWEKILKEQMR
jgi:RimJ/RimL family protein N-acetyltransferase